MEGEPPLYPICEEEGYTKQIRYYHEPNTVCIMELEKESRILLTRAMLGMNLETSVTMTVKITASDGKFTIERIDQEESDEEFEIRMRYENLGVL